MEVCLWYPMLHIYPLLWGLEVAVHGMLQYMALLRTCFLLNCHIVVVHSVQKLQCELNLDVECNIHILNYRNKGTEGVEV
jgi:hypothetical protein